MYLNTVTINLLSRSVRHFKVKPSKFVQDLRNNFTTSRYYPMCSYVMTITPAIAKNAYSKIQSQKIPNRPTTVF